MPLSKDPTVQRRRLLVELRRARTEAHLTQREVAARLDWSPSKLLRIENGSVGISAVDLRALLAEYGAKDRRKIDELVQLAKESKRQPYSEYRDVLAQPFLTYLGFEASASIIRQFEPQLVPGLLQTEEYALAVLTALNPGGDEALIQRRVEARMQRQDLLEQEDAGEFWFILDEAVIRRQVGGPGVMSRQLERIRELGTKKQINVQIVPFSAGAHYGMGGPFVVLEFNDPEADSLLFVENERGDLVSRDASDDISTRLESFWVLEGLASGPDKIEQVTAEALSGMQPAHTSTNGTPSGQAATT